MKLKYISLGLLAIIGAFIAIFASYAYSQGQLNYKAAGNDELGPVYVIEEVNIESNPSKFALAMVIYSMIIFDDALPYRVYLAQRSSIDLEYRRQSMVH